MSTSAMYLVSASSAVCKMVVRNVYDQILCNVAGNGSEMVRNVAEQVSPEMVRNVSEQVSNVEGFRVRVRHVSGSDSVMVSDVGWHGSLLTDVGGQGTNLISL